MEKKRNKVPSLIKKQLFTFSIYMGMKFNTVLMSVHPVQARLDQFHPSLYSLLAQPSTTARQLTSPLGMMESLSPLVLMGLFLKRPFQREFQQRWSPSSRV